MVYEIKQSTEEQRCCSKRPDYKIIYNHIEHIWLVCDSCYQLEIFQKGIKERGRLQNG